jgi:hypothetical protein
MMFTLKLDREPSGIEKAIDSILEEMTHLSADDEAYAKMVDQLVKLHEAKTKEGRRRPSPDALVAAAASLLSVLLIVNYERIHVVTTRALGFVPKAS